MRLPCWSSITGKPVRDLKEHTHRVYAIAFIPTDGRSFITGTPCPFDPWRSAPTAGPSSGSSKPKKQVPTQNAGASFVGCVKLAQTHHSRNAGASFVGCVKFAQTHHSRNAGASL